MTIADNFFVLSNRIEAGFWIVIGLIFAVAALRQSGIAWRRCAQGAVTLVLFGCSDVVEAETGAWWRPWWLLVWKVACVLVLLALLIDHWRRTRRRSRN
jgi:hypothetical protein